MVGSNYKRVRLADVAAAAEVSQSAVSMALRDSPQIGAKTRERIKRLCASMGYVGPHGRGEGKAGPAGVGGAGGLVTRRYGMLVLRVHSDPYIQALLDGLSDAAADKAGRVEVHVVNDIGDREKVIGRCLRFASALDGVILSGWVERYVLEALEERGVPFVTVGPFHEDAHGLPEKLNRAVMFDASAMGRLATEHLLGKGHTRVGFVAEMMPHHMFNAGWYDGYRLAVLNHDKMLDYGCVLIGDGPGTADEIAYGMLRETVRPTGFVISSGEAASLFLRTLSANGMFVDKADVVVCGDEEMLAEHRLLEYPAIVRSMKELARVGALRLHQGVVTGKAEYGVWLVPFGRRNWEVKGEGLREREEGGL